MSTFHGCDQLTTLTSSSDAISSGRITLHIRPIEKKHQLTIPYSLVLQGAGGGIAATADDNGNMLEVGDNLMIAGLAFQVFTLIVFALLSLDFFLKVWKNKNELNPSTNQLRSSLGFKLFLAALFTSYLTILVRCVYRVIEMAGGWGNSIMQNETIFLVLDSLYVIQAPLRLM